MNHLPKKTVLCGIFVILVFGGVFTFSIIAACPVDSKNCINGRDPVPFPHEMHMGRYDCLKCHHLYDSEHNNILNPMELYEGNPHIKCASCHSSESSTELTEAYHNQCIGCHYRSSGIRHAGGPNLCGECHRSGKQDAEPVMILGDQHD